MQLDIEANVCLHKVKNLKLQRIIIPLLLCFVKVFQSEMKLRDMKMENLTHAPTEEENLRTEKLIFHKCPF